MTALKIILGLLVSFLWSGWSLAEEFLDPDKAFTVRVESRDNRQLTVVWDIADGYKLYQDSMSAKPVDPSIKLPALTLPPGKRSFDKALNKEVSTYQKTVTGMLVLPEGQAPFDLEVAYQGCAIAGLCYPPQTRTYRIEPTRTGLQAEVTAPESSTAASAATPAAATAPADEAGLISGVLKGGNILKISAAFLVFGLLLSFTPCVLPMLPILSSIIVGQGVTSRRQSFMLAVSYSLGMALVYTALGVAAGLIGEGLAAFLQKPWVLTLFALLLVAMALSMFDVFQLQLPASWQGSVSGLSGRFQGGQHIGVFLMGALSSLIVGPCVAGPLAGALLYISQTRDVWMGGFALFAMACGMSVPLLLTGLSAGSLLPRAGNWMNHVKAFFGFMLLSVALWMVNPLMSDSVRLLAWGALLVLAAFFTPLFSPRQASDHFFTRVARALGVLVMVTGLAQFAGGLMGNTDMLTPLKSRGAQAATANEHVSFERIVGLQGLEAALKASDRPVVLDFYADWCTSCLEMEKLTFTDPKVVAQMQQWRRLQVDVTRNTAEDRALMRKFQLFGPPAMVFFDNAKEEIRDLRLVGYMAAGPFGQHLDKAISQRKR